MKVLQIPVPALRIENQECWYKSQSQGRRRLRSHLTQSGRKREFFLPLHFCTIQALSGLDNIHPPWGEQCAFFCPLIQMLISSPNTLQTYLEITFNQICEYLFAKMTRDRTLMVNFFVNLTEHSCLSP